MARIPYWMGKSESMNCIKGIKKFEIATAEGQVEVCYAAKVSQQAFILPYRVYVEDYVLSTDGNSYYNLNPSRVEYYQSIGELPSSLPKYQLNPFEMLWGNALWIVIGFFAIAYGVELIKGEKPSGSKTQEDQDSEQNQ